MAPLLSRLFSSRRTSVRHNSNASENDYLAEKRIWKTAEFHMDQIRVLLFRECDWRGRKLLFDSKSIKVVPPKTSPENSPSKRYIKILSKSNSNNDAKRNTPPPSKPVSSFLTEVSSNGTIYQYLRPLSDAKMLGEMIFGSVAMSYKGSTMKIHTIRSPMQLMLSEVFPAPSKPTNCGEINLEDSYGFQGSKESCPRPFNMTESWESSSVAHSIPVDVPEITKNGLWRKEDSGLPASGELSESYDSQGSNVNIAGSPDGYSSSNSSLTQSGSFSSMQRRWLRNRATSFEYGMKRAFDQDENTVREPRRAKLGIALVISIPGENSEDEKHFQEFFFSHISLIERHFKALQTAVSKAYLNKKDFVHQVMQALVALRSTIHDLYEAPRLQSPVWLSLMSHSSQNQALCQKFIAEFAELINEFDTKSTNFFISSLLTAVLTHHLSWVPTITPPGVPNSLSYHQKHSAKWLDLFAKSHPYNPLWLQLEDLYGVLGFPKRLSRTVISGKRKDLVLKFLFILTYFIRCSELKQSIEEIESQVDSLNHVTSNYNDLSDILECDDDDTPVTNRVGQCKSEPSNIVDKTYDSCSDNQSKNRYKMRGNELGLRLSLNNDNAPSCSSNSNEADDVFLCRTPDIDSGISEESTEDGIIRSTITKSENDSSFNLQQSDSNVTLCPNVENTEPVPCVKVVIEPTDNDDDTDSDVNDENVSTITQTSQLLKEYLSVRYAFQHNLSALGQKSDEPNNHEDCEGQQRKITDAKNKFYVHTENLSKQDDNISAVNCSRTNCECRKCKEKISNFERDCESVSTLDEYTLTNLAELSLPRSKVCESESLPQCFGRSLYASYSDHYMPDFCLQGMHQRASESTISRDLHSYIQHSNHEEITEAVCIVADTDTWTVHIESSNSSCKDTKTSVTTSVLISNMTESLLQLSKLKMSPDFCLMHLEDRLQELYFKSLLLTEYVRDCKMISVSKLSSSLGLDPSDIPLLMSIASTHSPCIVAAMPYS